MVRVTSVEDVQREVLGALQQNGTNGGRGRTRLRPVAGRTKTALAGVDDGETLLDVSALAGVRDYRPAECTFTAGAGTKVADVETMLAADGLCLPFEPPFSGQGATLGGTVGAGLSGAGRFRYGGVRDFLLGARFVDGEGRVVRGGGQVVKNAAGFYLQHLQLGALGRLGVLFELTFKVFPRAAAQVTLVADLATRDRAIDGLVRLRRSTFEIEALELTAPATLSIRLGGTASPLDARAAALIAFLGAETVRTLAPAEADALWAIEREFHWVGPAALVKVAITPGRIARLDDRLDQLNQRHQLHQVDQVDQADRADARGPGDDTPVARRYGAGGEVAWIAWPGPLDALDRLLTELALSGLVVTRGPAGGPSIAPAIAPAIGPLIGVRPDEVFFERVRAALDPRGVFA